MQMNKLTEYWDTKQGKTQSVKAYAERLTHLRRLVPKDTESERALVHRFLTNLSDPRVSRDVSMTYPATMEEAVSKARQSAASLARSGTDTEPRRPPVLLNAENKEEELNFDAKAEVVLAFNKGRPTPFQWDPKQQLLGGASAPLHCDISGKPTLTTSGLRPLTRAAGCCLS